MPRRYSEAELSRNFLFEMSRQGQYVRVSAIDPVTNTEISMVGDPAVGTEQLKVLARNKLLYVMRKKGLVLEPAKSGRQRNGSTLA